MTKHEKEISRQKQIWFTMIASTLITIGALVLVGMDKDVNGLGVILGSFYVAAFGKEGVNLFTNPSADK